MSGSDILMAKGEKGLYTRNVKPNLFLFWLTTRITVTNKRVVAKYPNTILGLIPLGYEEKSMPIKAIAGVSASFKVYAVRLVFFAILTLACLLLLVGDGNTFFSLLFTLFFGACTANALSSALVLTNQGGGETEVKVSFLDKAAIEAVRDKANEFIYAADME